MAGETAKPLMKFAAAYKTLGSVKTLRGSYKGFLKELDMEHILEELMGQSDRACIILISSLLEEAVKMRIAYNLGIHESEADIENVFRLSGPLSSFSAKNEIAYLFGAIDENIFKQLDAVREIRNACAHSRFQIAFERPEISNVLLNGFYSPVGFLEYPNAKIPSKECFLVESMIIYRTIYTGRKEALENVAGLMEQLKQT